MLKFEQECADTLIKVEKIHLDLFRVLSKTSNDLEDSNKVSKLYDAKGKLFKDLIDFRKDNPEIKLSEKEQKRIDRILDNDKRIMDRVEEIKNNLSQNLKKRNRQKQLLIYSKEH